MESNNIVEYGNLALGIGTFSLALILAFVNWRNNIRNRAVHIADKRKDWMTEFRSLISELLSIQNKLIKVDSSIYVEWDQLFQQLATVQYKIHFMFPSGNSKAEKLNTEIGSSSIELTKVNPEISVIVMNREKIMNIASQILEEQRENIVKLNKKDVLI